MTFALPARLPAWAALVVFSLVSLLAVVEDKNNGVGNGWNFEEKWSVALLSVSFGLSVIACAMHAVGGARDKFVASKAEGIVVSVRVQQPSPACHQESMVGKHK